MKSFHLVGILTGITLSAFGLLADFGAIPLPQSTADGLKGQRIQYNFVKPHTALEGQTPAQAAGIEIGSKDKWMELLKKSTESRALTE
jgi:hypothetical protein